MDIQGIGSTTPIYDKQTFGAAVVGKTLSYMHGTSSPPAAFDKETFGAAVVSTTLDYMHTNTNRYQNQNTYSFQKDVLGAYAGKGTILDTGV